MLMFVVSSTVLWLRCEAGHRVDGLAGNLQQLVLCPSLRLPGFQQVLLQLLGFFGPERQTDGQTHLMP